MTKRRDFLLAGGVAATVPLVAKPTAAAADAHTGDRSDEQLINRLLVSYCRALDTRDEAAVAAVFLPNASIRYDLFEQDEFTSAAEFAHYVITGLAAIAQVQHYLSNVEVWVSGNEADSSSYIYSPAIRKNGTYIMVGGQYQDKLRRTQSGWRIARRRFKLFWTLGGDV